MKAKAKPQQPWTPQQMCEYLQISRTTLRVWQRKRLIPFTRIGGKRGRSIVRYDVNAVDAALSKWKTKATGE